MRKALRRSIAVSSISLAVAVILLAATIGAIVDVHHYKTDDDACALCHFRQLPLLSFVPVLVSPLITIFSWIVSEWPLLRIAEPVLPYGLTRGPPFSF